MPGCISKKASVATDPSSDRNDLLEAPRFARPDGVQSAWSFPGRVQRVAPKAVGFAAGCLLALLLSASGCAGYRLGPTGSNQTAGSSIQVYPFTNKTAVPQLNESITIALRRVLQQNGNFRLATDGAAALELRGVLTRYERESLSAQRNDLLATRDFNVVVTAEVTVVDRRTGKVVFEGAVTGRTTLRAGADLVSAERQAMPLLADDLARRLTVKLTEGSW